MDGVMQSPKVLTIGRLGGYATLTRQAAHTLHNSIYFFYSSFSPLYFGLFFFQFTEDPTEHNNLADKMPDLVEKLKARMAEYKKKYVQPNYPGYDADSNPKNYGGAWTPGWC